MSNYKAMVAKIDRVVEINGADNIQIAFVLNESVIVSKEMKEGGIGVFFTAGTQLSSKFAQMNNLNRDPELNKDKTKKGFFDNNLKVRAQPFMKVKSEGYFTTLDSLSFTGHDISKLKVGDSFEDLNGVNICNKYINPNHVVKATNNKAKKDVCTDFKPHVDTSQLKYNIHKIKKGDLISIQSKRHGSSGRTGYLKKNNELNFFKRVINKFVEIYPKQSYEFFTGSRRVVLGKNSQEGFHGSNGFRYEITESLKPFITKGMTLYYEIVGYVNGKPIMSTHNTKDLKDKRLKKKYGDVITYKYNCLQDEYRFHVYRITMTDDFGNVTEYTQPQLVAWCKQRGIEPSYDVVQPFVFDGDSEALLRLVESLTEREDVLTEDYHDPSQVSEGVIIRVDNEEMQPQFYKNKSYFFKIMENICEEVDIEDIS